jgi:hypothetical protein
MGEARSLKLEGVSKEEFKRSKRVEYEMIIET